MKGGSGVVDIIMSGVNASKSQRGVDRGVLTTYASLTIAEAINPTADTITVTTHGCQWSANEVYCPLNIPGTFTTHDCPPVLPRPTRRRGEEKGKEKRRQDRKKTLS